MDRPHVYKCALILIHMHTYTCTHTYTYTHTHMLTNSCTLMPPHTCMYIHSHMHMNATHTYICTCVTPAQMHTHIYTQYGHPALYFAASNGHEDVVELLLGAKADPDLTDVVI